MAIQHVLVFPNQMVAVFDDAGNQMPEYQGRWSEMRSKILRDKPAHVNVTSLARFWMKELASEADFENSTLSGPTNAGV